MDLISRSVIAVAVIAASTVLFLKNKRYGSRSLPPVKKYYIPDPIKNVITPIRPLGALEGYYAASHNTGVYCCVGYGVQLEGQIPSADQLISAAQQWIRKYPLMRSAIIDTDKSPSKGPSYFCWMNKIDLRSAFRSENRTDSNTWLEVLLKELHTPFIQNYDTLDKNLIDQAGLPPLFKFVLVAPPQASGAFEIVFGVHHAIADGMAGITLFRDFLELLSEAIHSNATPIILEEEVDPKIHQCQPLDLLLDIRPTVWNLLKAVAALDFSILKATRKDWLGPPQVASPHRTSRLVLAHIPKQEIDALLQKCRSHHVTLNAAMYAATNFAVAKTLKRYPVISGHTACNLRSYCQPKLPPNTTGTFVCGPETCFSLHGKINFWEFARQAKKHQVAAVQDAYRKIGMLNFLSSVHEFFEKKRKAVPNGRDATLDLSNLGSIPFPESFQCFSLKGCYFANAKTAEGPVIMESVVTVQGTLYLTLGYVEQILTREEAETIVKYILEALKKCEDKQLNLQDFISS